MPSLILRLAARHLMPLFLLVSVYFLFRGHNHPGGGFIGGLLAAEAFILTLIAEGVAGAEARIPIDPGRLVAIGLLVAVGSGIPALFHGAPFMTAQSISIEVPFVRASVHLRTPTIFDTGVYLLVTGIVLTIVLTLAKE